MILDITFLMHVGCIVLRSQVTIFFFKMAPFAPFLFCMIKSDFFTEILTYTACFLKMMLKCLSSFALALGIHYNGVDRPNVSCHIVFVFQFVHGD